MIIFVPCIDFSRVAAQASLAVGLLLLAACGGGGGGGGVPAPTTPTTPTTPPTTLDRPSLANASAANLTVGARATITFANSRGGTLTGCTVSPTLPTGLGVSRTSGNASCRITGTPSVTRGRTTYRVTATNDTGVDTTPATVSITVGAMPTAATVMATTASISVPSTATGTAYVMFLPRGAAAPTAAAIKAAVMGGGAGSGGVVAASSMAVTAGTQATVNLAGLEEDTEYDAYVVVESDTGTLGTIMKVDVATPPAPPPPPPPPALARPDLANASAANFIAGRRANAITFTNNGGGVLTNCAVAPPLPTGLDLDRTSDNGSCEITGTPRVVSSRTYTITATNATGADSTPATVSITVAAAPVVLARPNLANASAASLTAGTRASTILFTNNGGGMLTGCAVDKTLPTGLDLDRTSDNGNASCEITGIPSVVSGPTIYTVIATNATGADTTPATVSITVAPARPDLANASAASLVAGTEITTINFVNSGGGMLTNCAVDKTLPTGLDLDRTSDNASCEITGIPATATAEATYTITATNATGADSTPATVSITVTAALARPNLANAPAANLIAGTEITAITFTNSGGGMLTGCAVDKTLPTGLDLDRTSDNGSCEITGTPNAVSGPTTYTVTATNATGADTTPATVSITVNPALPDLANAAAASLVAGTEITAISFTNSGGGMLTGCAVDKTLPTGLDLDRTSDNGSCEITGTPRVVSGPTTYRVTATNATGADTTPATVSITVAPARPDLANASAANLTAGTEITAINFANNGGGMLTNCAVDKTLPTGLDLDRTSDNSSCEITGTPRVVSGQTTYTVTATNATGADATPATVSITVAPARPDLAGASAASLTAGTRASTILFTNNGGGALTRCAVAPPLPTGLDLDRTSDNSSCEITGTPRVVSGPTTYTVTATNATGADTTPVTVSITVNPALPNLANASAANITAGTEITTITFTNSGGGMLTGCAVAPPLPTGLDLDRTSDNASCEITGTPDAATVEATYTITATNATGADSTPATVSITVEAEQAEGNVDSDGDGLIEINTLEKLNNVRHSLDGAGYKTSADGTPDTTGCPNDVCRGYELTAALTFDVDGDGSTWTRNGDGSVTLDAGDDNDTYFDIASDGSSGGWVPIGDCGPNGSCVDDSSTPEDDTADDAPFTAVFEGNDHTITGLAIVRDLAYIGLFGATGTGADIRNLGLVGNLARKAGTSRAYIGGLVGRQGDGSITASYATGDADGGAGDEDYVGGLVGYQSRGPITASRATGDADGGAGNKDYVGGLVGFSGGSITDSYATGDADGGIGDNDWVGGLVGIQENSSITASHATGNTDGGPGIEDNVGGLVGWQFGGSITASYASGYTSGGNDGGSDNVGGLVGLQQGDGSITASYANGDVDRGAGSDRVGKLVGYQDRGSATASWGLGKTRGRGIQGIDSSFDDNGDSDRPLGVSSAADFTSANVPTSWNEAASNTSGAWNFGTASQAPALNYADYDGPTVGTAGSYTSGHLFHCASDSANAPDDAILIPNCGTLIPSVASANVLLTTADINVISGTAGTAYIAVLADGAAAPTAAAIKAAVLDGGAGSGGVVAVGSAAVVSRRATVSLTGLMESSMHDAYIVVESGTGTLGTVMKVNVNTQAAVSVENVLATGADIPVLSGTAGTAYIAALADGAAAPTAAAIKAAVLDGGAGSGGVVAVSSAGITAGTRAAFRLTGLMGDTAYDVYIVVESGGVLGTVVKVDLDTVAIVDADGDGLIEIGTLAELNNVRYSLDGAGYRTSADAIPNPSGCPNNRCRGYELTADLTFDADGDGNTWTRNSDGSVTLDTDDDNDTYFDIASDGSSGGWVPIADNSRRNGIRTRFTAVFEGNDHTITGLATVRDLTYIGLFGATGTGSAIRNLGLVGNLAKKAGRGNARVGGLVGLLIRSYLSASHATGDADGGIGGDYVGGLVGYQSGGTVTASRATGNVDGGAGVDWVGGLVGYQSGYQPGQQSGQSGDFGSITASHATGNVDGGAGDDAVGGLVGQQFDSFLAVSYATGDADGGSGSDWVGGLVGHQAIGSITASHATGNADGGIVGSNYVGGLVGYLSGGSVTASYAIGDAGGGAGRDFVGGLVGGQFNGGSITASYAAGDADGGAGSDRVGGLVGGRQSGDADSNPVTASWGFGSAVGENDGIDGSVDDNGDSDLPNGVSSVADLTSANVLASWNEAASNTLGAWDFGTASQPPALNYADYDGATVGTVSAYTSGHLFHCASDSDNAPIDAVLIPNCDTLIPGVFAANVLDTTADISVLGSAAGTAYVAVLADGAMAPTAAAIKAATAGSGGMVAVGSTTMVSGRATVSLTGLMASSMYDAYIVVESGGVLGTVMKIDLVTTPPVIDADGDGLIEIGTLAELNNVRHSLDGAGYKTSAIDTPNTTGCPAGGCRGYELTADLDFDVDGDGSSWTRNSDGSVTLDTGDDNNTYFDIASDGSSGGWVPISRFTAVFEGNGHTITGLATVRNLTYIGLFGRAEDADIRNLGLVGNLAKKVGTGDARVGGLVGLQSGGSVTASHATGDADGGAGSDSVGGLVGGLRGRSSITASWATGDVDGGAGGDDQVGGLVGYQSAGSITASWATGDADGDAGDDDQVGGLVGYQSAGSITASYATGDTDGGDGINDFAGGLIGISFNNSSTTTASWGFGSTTGERNGVDGSVDSNGDSDLPNGVSSVADLTSANVPASWNQASSSTLGAWDFGTASQAPRLNRADYDGPTVGLAPYAFGHRFHCANDAANVPADAIIISDCAVPRPVSATNVLAATADINVTSSTAGTAYIAVLADGAAAPTAAAIKAATAGSGGVVAAGSMTTVDGRATVSLTGLMADTAYDVYVVVESNANPPILGTVTKVDLDTMPIVDADGDGLIEIGTLAELNNVRHNLAGTTYRADPGVAGDTGGCPAGICRGYELTADLDFDADGDGSSWTRNSDGSVTLDTGDDNDAYFDIASDGNSGGWVPIGSCRVRSNIICVSDDTPFTAIFEGNGHTITGLATARDLPHIGLFGRTDGAHIRNLGLVGNLARNVGTNGAHVGGLVGQQDGGSITTSYATGDADGGKEDKGVGGDDIGGLVGHQDGGSITASYSTGNVNGGTGGNQVGGLVGYQIRSSITASYATGDVVGGAGSGESVGGLVGWQHGRGSITASYATGDADGGAGVSDRVGGLVGYQSGQGGNTVSASYATGNVDGGDNGDDRVGRLVGLSDGTITASWGFGSKAGGEANGIDGSVDGNGDSDLPDGVTSAVGLTSANVPASWNQASSNTLGAWDFGTTSQAPALNYADYDGATVGTAGAYTSGHLFHCASDEDNAPSGAILVSNCGTLLSGIFAANVLLTTADINVTSSTAGTVYVAVLADGAMAPTAAAIKAATAGSGGVVAVGSAAVTASTRTTVSLTGLMGDTAYDVYVVVESSANPPVLGTVTKVDLDTMPIVDADGDGLIEIGTLAELNNVRYSLDGAGYKTSASDTPNTNGCPNNVCRGYELTADLDFDVDGDGSTWVRNSDGSVTLDTGDNNDTYFDMASDGTGGWVPIGDDSTRFTAVFEGNGHTIAGLAIVRDLGYIGLFGVTDSGADIRNLGLVGNLARKVDTFFALTARVGGLVGQQSGGSITASHAAGDADGGTGSDWVGGLVGYQAGGSITASHATGNAEGGAGGDSVGGLVGYQAGGSITASHATGNAEGGAGGDSVGGLVGRQFAGSITASYATGNADGGTGSDWVGGLVGYQSNGSIAASYAAGDADGGFGSDFVGGLAGRQSGGSITASYAAGGADGGAGNGNSVGGLTGRQSGGSITASWGFGKVAGGGTDDSDRPNGVSSAADLTSANVPASWNAAASSTLGAWNFGTATQPPALNYADYDGATVGTAGSYTSGHLFHCASDSSNAPDDAVLIPNCGTLIPGVVATNVLATTADINVLGSAAGTAYIAVLADGAMAPTAADIKAAMAGSGGVVAVGSAAVASGRATVSLTGLMESSMYDAYIVVESGGVLGTVTKVDLVTTQPVIDADGDGLIEIGTLAELNNVRYSLDGAEYKTSASATPNTNGCLNDVCRGYELTASLDFDADSDGSTWVRNSDGSVTLDTGDDNDTYFDIASGGWVPIGDNSTSNNNTRFTAIFEGNGHTITGLATVRDLAYIGLFGAIGTGADIRNLGLVGNLARMAGTGNAHVGGLVGEQDGGSITASHATGDADGGTGNDHVGGLVGWLRGRGSITASHATGDADGGAGDDWVGGLVGEQDGGSITATRATGDVDGGVGNDLVGGLVGWLRGRGSITASHAAGDADGGTGSDDRVGGLVGGQSGTSSSITASYATGDADGGVGDRDRVGGLVGWQNGTNSITASYATGDSDGGGRNDYVGGLVGEQLSSASATASWGFGTATGKNDGIDGSVDSSDNSDRPVGVSSAADLTSANVPASWNEAASSTLGAWNFGTASQAPALNYADYDGATVGTVGAYTGGHIFHCASDSANAPDETVLIPNCGTLIPGQRVVSSPAPSGYVDLSGSSILGDSGTVRSIGSSIGRSIDRSGSIQHGLYYASASLWMPEDESGTGADTSKSGADISTDKKDSSEDISLIATFDDATDDLAAIRASTGKYSLTGIFANPSLANWNNFDGEADSAHVGGASVSTWQIGTMVEAQAMGSIRINGVAVEGDYINFLMAGGGAGANVGVSIYVAGTGKVVVAYAPNFCADKYLKGEQHWAHFDVRDLKGKVVDIEIRDHDATNDCGFIAFDHFYQSDSSQGTAVGVASQPALR